MIVVIFYALLLTAVVYLGAGFAAALRLGDNDCLPLHLRDKKHDDRVLPFCWIPRRLTARPLPEPPIMVAGSPDHAMSETKNGEYGPSPIPGKNQWQISVVPIRPGSWLFLPYFALTTRCVHFRIGTRWDDIDHYYTLDSLAVKVKRF